MTVEECALCLAAMRAFLYHSLPWTIFVRQSSDDFIVAHAALCSIAELAIKGLQAMIMQNKTAFDFTNRKLMTIFLVVFWTGALTLMALALGAFIAVIYLINLVLDAVAELVAHLTSLYTHTDSLGKVLLLIVGLIVVSKLAPWVARSLQKSYRSVRQVLGR